MKAHFPHSIDFIVTTRCNLFCRVCWGCEMPEYQPLPVEGRKELFDRIREHGVRQVVFTGGEPLLDEALPGLLAHAHASFRTFLFTNALLFPEQCGALLPHVDRMSFSLDGATDCLNAVARGQGHYQKVIDSLRIIRQMESPPDLQVLTVVTRQNRDHLDAIGTLLRSECRQVRFRWKLNFCRDMGRFHDEFALPYDEFVEAAEAIKREFGGRLPVRYSLDQHDDAYLFVLPDGNMYTPEGRAYRPVGNLLDPRTHDAGRISAIAANMMERHDRLSKQERSPAP